MKNLFKRLVEWLSSTPIDEEKTIALLVQLRTRHTQFRGIIYLTPLEKNRE